MMTLRDEVERELGVTPARIGRRSPAWYIHQAPSSWRKTVKYWSALMLGFFLGAVIAGIMSVLFTLGS